MLDKEWDIILNNNIDKELIVLHVPEGAFSVRTDTKSGLFVRSDKLDLIDLKINVNTFKDFRSGEDFSNYIIHRIKY